MKNQRPPGINGLLKEHIDSRKGWGAYVTVMTQVHDSVATDTRRFLADMRRGIDSALRRTERR